MKLQLIQNQLKTYNLNKSFKERWLDSIKMEFISIEPIQITYLDNNDIDDLLREGKYAEVACSLLSQGEINELSPLHYAITTGNTLLLIALLANGLEVGNKSNSDDAHLAFAIAYNNTEIFNLLLLVDDINTNDVYFLENELSDIASYFGEYNYGDYFSALTWLQRPEYHHIHEFLEIDWDLRWGENNNPLIFYAYLNDDFKMMDRLVSLGASMNPYIDYNNYTSLLEFAVESWSKNKPATYKGLEWFAKYCSFLSEDYDDHNNILTALILDECPAQCQSLGLKGLDLIEDTINEYKDEIESLQSKLYDQNIPTTPYEHIWSHYNITTSLFMDLAGNERVIFNDQVRDFLVSSTNPEVIEFGILSQNSNFPDKISIQIEALNKILGGLYWIDKPLEIIHLYNLSDFQKIYWFTHCPVEILVIINMFANSKGINIFKAIKGASITTDTDYERMLNFYYDYRDNLCYFLSSELYNHLSTYLKIHNELTYGKMIPANENIEDNTIHRNHHPSNKADDIFFDGKYVNINMSIGDEEIRDKIHYSNWILGIQKTRLFKICPDCKELFSRPSMAYDDVCIECINK
ncbi:hypothetical protein [Buttiauxella massiliensis]|uniref:hypothetical protein n=1 Tax=Buttiauxella massiliensis TaxID=2831590 RepID=UPI00125F7234|nr:hypothetical protein [Buttiauxella massiliensis]